MYRIMVLCILILGGHHTLPAQSALTWNASEQARFASLPVVPVGTDATWPPMEYINERREIVGFDIDLLREIGLRAGFQPQFSSVPWDGIFLGLASQQYQMIASSVTLLEERRERMLFSTPYMIAAQYLVVPRGSNANTLEDLARQQVGAQIGTTGAQIAGDAGTVVRTYDDLGLAVEDLYRGRLAGIVADVAIVEYYILNHPRYGNALQVVETPYAQENYAFAFALDQGPLRDVVDSALREMIADGTVQRLKEFWFRRIIPPTPQP